MFTTEDLAKRYNVHRSTIYAWREAGNLPAPLVIGKTTVRWREQDIAKFEEWLLEQTNVIEAGGDPTTVPVPEYSLPVSDDAHSMARERLAASCDPPSEMISRIDSLKAELDDVAAAMAIMLSRNIGINPSKAELDRLKKILRPEVKEEVLEMLPPEYAERLEAKLNKE